MMCLLFLLKLTSFRYEQLFSLTLIFSFPIYCTAFNIFDSAVWETTRTITRKSNFPGSLSISATTNVAERPLLSSEYLDGVKIYLLRKEDLEDACKLSVECFYKPRFTVNTTDVSSPIERRLLNGLVSLLSFLDKGDAWLSNYVGFLNRAGDRLRNPHWRACDDSLIIAAFSSTNNLDKVSSPNTVPTQSQSQWADHRTLIGLVEICLEKPTGLLTSPMRPVDFFGLLPANKAKQGSGFKPYICNLCIAEAGRRKGLGKLLCSICEQVARDEWGYEDMYLHVQEENLAALNLYESMGYQRKYLLSEQHIKFENMENIRYYWRNIRNETNTY